MKYICTQREIKREFVRFHKDCDGKGKLSGLLGGGLVAIHSSGQSVFSFSHIEGITLGADKEVDEVAAGASGMGADRNLSRDTVFTVCLQTFTFTSRKTSVIVKTFQLSLHVFMRTFYQEISSFFSKFPLSFPIVVLHKEKIKKDNFSLREMSLDQMTQLPRNVLSIHFFSVRLSL